LAINFVCGIRRHAVWYVYKLSEQWLEFYGLLVNMLHLNVIALTELTILFVHDMVKQKSRKILAQPPLTNPCRAWQLTRPPKAYVVNFTEALHAELKGTGVTATVLNPGVTGTGFIYWANMKHAGLAQGAQASPAEVAKAGYQASKRVNCMSSRDP
jgi:NADP-dependent 3-hydroxy acid dehydrogenase YdfG